MKKVSKIGLLLVVFVLVFSNFAFASGHGYHFIRATNKNFSDVYGHFMIPAYYASTTKYETYPEIFYGFYTGSGGLDVGLYSKNNTWIAFTGMNSVASSTGKYYWAEGSSLKFSPEDKVYLEAQVTKSGNDYYLVLFCKKNGSFSNKNQVLKEKLSANWGAKVFKEGAIVNREVSLASNNQAYLTKSNAYLYNAVWVDSGCVTPDGRTYLWSKSLTNTNSTNMFNDDGKTVTKYFRVITGESNGYATENVTIDYRGIK